VTGLTTFTGLVTTQATRITPGGQDIGDGGMVTESGPTAITLCEDTDRQGRAAIDVQTMG